MAQDAMSQEIARRLGDEVASDPKLMEECACRTLSPSMFANLQSFTTGLSICRIYNLTPEQLQFKWEAATFSATPARAHEAARFTMDSLAGVKAQIKRELNRSSTGRAQPRAFGGTASINRARLPQFMAQNIRNAARAGVGEVKIKAEPFSDGLDSTRLAGPSRATSKVVFKGPKMDASSRKNRACEWPHCFLF